ncbi:cytochrome P450 monooxygenase, partial [Apiospora kogelbergensis]
MSNDSVVLASVDAFHSIRQHATARLQEASRMEILVLLLGLYFTNALLFRKKSPTLAGAKVYGYRSAFEPALSLQIRFTTSANSIIHSAYSKLKNTPFILRRYDTDITVLPGKYLDEMRLVPRHKLNGKKAQVNNLVPRWTWTQVMMNSDLHVNVLNAKLNPELPKYIEIAEAELNYAWNIDVPRPETWEEVDIQQSMRMLVARMSARLFMGYPACREEEWLKVSINFTYDMFLAAFTLRMFPPWMHLFVAPFVPARWRIRSQMRTARKYVGELTRKHTDALSRGEKGQDTLLSWMIDNGTEEEKAIPEMAARQCVLTLASIHTTSMSVSNLLFDLCTYPEWFPVLREEIDEVVKAHGRIEEGRLNHKQWLAKLEKMDSFIIEDQRINPPILLNPQRIALEALTLKDGTKIPKGARIAWAGHELANDADVVARPERFDPLRSYRKRHADYEKNKHRFTAGQTNAASLSFGYGGQACPGRYFAVAEIKLVLMRLLLEFEFRLPDGKKRPQTMYADENVFMDPSAKLMMRTRKDVA